MHRTKKITVLALYEKNSGGETLATELIVRALQKHSNLLEVSSYTLDPLLKTSSIRYFWWLITAIAYSLCAIIRQKMAQRIDWIYTTTFTAATASAILKQLFLYRLCFHYHGNRIPDTPDKKHSLLRRLAQFIKRMCAQKLHVFALKRCDLIVVPTWHTKQQLLRLFPFLKQTKITIIPNGPVHTPLRSTLHTKPSLRNRLKIRKQDTVLVTLGRLTPKKGFDTAIACTLELSNKKKDICMIIGYLSPQSQFEQDYLKHLQRVIKHKRLQSVVYLLANPQPSELYAAADLVISFSKEETFSLVMLEAFAHQRLFVTTNTQLGFFLNQISTQQDQLILTSTQKTEFADQILKLLALPKSQKKRIIVNAETLLTTTYSWSNASALLLKNFYNLWS